MDKVNSRALMLKEKVFLGSLYKASTGVYARKLLSNASDRQLKVVIQIIHLIASKMIPISSEAQAALAKARKANFITKNFKDKSKTKRMFKLDRKPKVDILCKLASLYRFLFYRIFNKNDASIVREPTCQEMDISVEQEETDVKNSPNDLIEVLVTFKNVNCTNCKDKISALKNFKDIVDHIELHYCKFCHENLKSAIGLDKHKTAEKLSNDPIEGLKTIQFVNSAYCKDKIGALKKFTGVVDLIDSSNINTEVIEVAIDSSIVGEPTCQEMDMSIEQEETDAKNSSNEPIEDLETIKIVNCTYCKDKIGALKNFQDVVDHIGLHNCKFCSEYLKSAIGFEIHTEVNKVAIENRLETELASIQNEETKVECVEKTSKIQALEIANVKLETELASTQNALEETEVECFESDKEIQTLEIAKIKLETELASTQNALEETKVECFEKNSKIQALEIAKVKLETEVTSAQKALEELKAESKKELEKVENQLRIEAASKKSLEELRQDWAVKVYQSDRKNEDLVNLLSLEPEKLFKKYEQIIKFDDSNMVKVEEGNDNSAIRDKKLKLQILQRELYEKELDGIMDVLKMSSGDRVYTNILPVIKNMLEQVDTEHYTNAVENLIN